MKEIDNETIKTRFAGSATRPPSLKEAT